MRHIIETGLLFVDETIEVAEIRICALPFDGAANVGANGGSSPEALNMPVR